MPKRVQMRRDRPWREDHPEAIRVDRGTRWGNPFKITRRPHSNLHDVRAPGLDGLPSECAGSEEGARSVACQLFRSMIYAGLAGPAGADLRRKMDEELRGRDLACWCPLDADCHADVLLEMANEVKG